MAAAHPAPSLTVAAAEGLTATASALNPPTAGAALHARPPTLAAAEGTIALAAPQPPIAVAPAAIPVYAQALLVHAAARQLVLPSAMITTTAYAVPWSPANVQAPQTAPPRAPHVTRHLNANVLGWGMAVCAQTPRFVAVAVAAVALLRRAIVLP